MNGAGLNISGSNVTITGKTAAFSFGAASGGTGHPTFYNSVKGYVSLSETGGNFDYYNDSITNSDGDYYKYFTTIPQTTVERYDLYVGGKQITSANASDVFSDGKVSYDADNKTLTLNGYTFSGTGYYENFGGSGDSDEYSAVFSKIDALTINLKGSNSLTETGGHQSSNGIYSKYDLTFTGDGSLDVTAGTHDYGYAGHSCGINGQTQITLDSTFTGSITAIAGNSNNYNGIQATMGCLAPRITVKGGTLNATGGNVTVSGSGCSYGIYANYYTQTGGNVTGIGNTGGYVGDSSYGLYGAYSVSITGGTFIFMGDDYAVQDGLSLGSGINAIASVNKNGNGPVVYDSGSLSSYKYISSSATTQTAYDLYIAGTQITSLNASDLSVISGVTGTANYDATTNMLNLNGTTITGSYGTDDDGGAVVYFGDNSFKINAIGTNTITGGTKKEHAAGLMIADPSDLWSSSSTKNVNVTITVADGGRLTINGGSAEGGYYPSSFGIFNSLGGTLTVSGSGTLNINGSDTATYSYGISSGKDVRIEDSIKMNVAGGDVYDSYGIASDEKIIFACNTGATGASVEVSAKSSTGSAQALLGTVQLGESFTIAAAASTESDGGNPVIYNAADNSTYKWFKTPAYTYDFNVTPGANMTKTSASGAASQEVLEGSPITDVVFTADDGYYFPESYFTWDTPTYGITVHRDSDTQFTVSGTPTTNYSIAFSDAVVIPPKAPTPIFTPAAQSFTESVDVTITCTLTGATVYYTDDGSTPSATNGTVTTGAAITLTDTTTLKAIAVMAGYDDSEVATATYTKTTPSSGGGGGGTATPETYEVKPATAENGKITVSPENAAEGDKVTITVTPDEGYELDKLTVKDKDGNEIAVKDNGDGTYTITMPASEIEVEAEFKEAEETPGEDDFPFVDVPEDAYYRKPVEWAVEKGITAGVSEDEYGPELSCTRAQVVTFLWITCGSEDAGNETGFDDVDVDAYYDKAVAWAVENGITAGTSEGEFSPDLTVTRAQFVTMLWVANGKPEVDGELPFKDVPADSYYAKAVAWAYANDITAGKSADSFGPDDPCTRGQIMTFLYNAFAE